MPRNCRPQSASRVASRRVAARPVSTRDERATCPAADCRREHTRGDNRSQEAPGVWVCKGRMVPDENHASPATRPPPPPPRTVKVTADARRSFSMLRVCARSALTCDPFGLMSDPLCDLIIMQNYHWVAQYLIADFGQAKWNVCTFMSLLFHENTRTKCLVFVTI